MPHNREHEVAAALTYSRHYRRYVLGLLTLVGVLNFMDRQILSILLQPIKEDLALSDTQLGFLGGIAFAVFFIFFSIPLAAWADRGNRRSIVALALLVWSAMTALCGFAVGFVTLLLPRIGVAIGEAGGGPASQSLIADYFSESERSRAMSVVLLAIPLGILVGFLSGGWINEWFGWRAAFLLVGAPGVVVALVLRLTLREPPRGHSEGRRAADAAPSLRETLTYLWRCHSYRHMLLASALHAFVGYGTLVWVPAFLMRSHGMGTGEAGTWIALLAGFAGGAGTLVGGAWAGRLARRDRRWYLWLPALATLLTAPFLCFTYLWREPTLALTMYAIPMFFGTFWSGPVHAVGQSIAGLRMRAMAAAVLLFVINVIGLGMGPLLVGVASDVLHPRFGANSLRYALVSVVFVNVWSALHYYLGARTLRSDLDAVPD